MMKLNRFLMIRFKSLFLILLILSALSCEKTMFLDIDEDNRKIVMNGIMTPDYGLWLNLSSSISPTHPPVSGFEPIRNGKVSYYNQDTLINTIYENSLGNYYDTNYLPRIGKPYKIVVEVPGLPQATSIATIPDPVPINDFNTDIVVRSEGDVYNGFYNEVDFFINFTMNDPGPTKNYYMLGVYYLKEGRYRALRADTEDLNVNIYIKDGVNILAWDDQEFNGQMGEFTVFFRLMEPDGFGTRFRFHLYSIEESYFKYLKSYSQNFTVLNEDVFLFEAVPVYSNIEGGYGIVAAVSSDVKTFEYTF